MGNNTVNFETAKDAPLASAYTLWHADEDGHTTAVHEFDGEEIVRTSCPKCGEAHDMPLLEFCVLMAGGDFDLYGSMIYCEKCSAEMNNKG